MSCIECEIVWPYSSRKKKQKLKAYLAHSIWDKDSTALKDVKELLQREGYEIIDSHDLEYSRDKPIEEQIRETCFPVIDECDLVVAVRSISPGVQMEYEYAKKQGKKVIIW